MTVHLEKDRTIVVVFKKFSGENLISLKKKMLWFPKLHLNKSDDKGDNKWRKHLKPTVKHGGDLGFFAVTGPRHFAFVELTMNSSAHQNNLESNVRLFVK